MSVGTDRSADKLLPSKVTNAIMETSPGSTGSRDRGLGGSGGLHVGLDEEFSGDEEAFRRNKESNTPRCRRMKKHRTLSVPEWKMNRFCGKQAGERQAGARLHRD